MLQLIRHVAVIELEQLRICHDRANEPQDHAANGFREAAQLGRKYDNVYLELSGQPPQAINEIIKIMGSEKILFGTDWPFYPLAFPLAKVLLATENNPVDRQRILKTNAERLLAKFPQHNIEQGISLLKYIFNGLVSK